MSVKQCANRMTDQVCKDATVPLDDIPLLKSAWLGRIRLARMLIEGGAPVNQTNSIGQTALAVCCISNHKDEQTTSKPKFISYLLEKGADPNVQDKYGRTALLYLIQHQHNHLHFRICMRLLLESGTDILLKDTRNRNALNYASDTGNMRIVMALANSLKANGNKVVVLLMENTDCKHCLGPCVHSQRILEKEQPLSRVSSRMTLTCVTPEEVMAEIPPEEHSEADDAMEKEMEKELRFQVPEKANNTDEDQKRGPGTFARHQSLQLIEKMEKMKADSQDRPDSDSEVNNSSPNSRKSSKAGL